MTTIKSSKLYIYINNIKEKWFSSFNFLLSLSLSLLEDFGYSIRTRAIDSHSLDCMDHVDISLVLMHHIPVIPSLSVSLFHSPSPFGSIL